MDRRQRKTREAIFSAFVALLSEKDFGQITVAEIIDRADVGRATFYSHFETKDFLLRELCAELFCHIFDGTGDEECHHRHIFECEAPECVFLHLLTHLKKNDNNILRLLSGQNNELFLRYFKDNLGELVSEHLYLFEGRKAKEIPDSLWEHHICSIFVEAVRWWIGSGMQQSPEKVREYFFLLV